MSARSRPRIRAKSRLAGDLVCLAVLLVLSAAAQALAQELDTLEPGKLIVGFNGDMPMTSLQGWAAHRQRRQDDRQDRRRSRAGDRPSQADWAAVIESTTSGRNDVMLGAMGWTEERTEVMTLTDPIYYFGTLLAQKTDNNYSTFADMAGKKVGTVTGFTLVPELKAVPGIGEAKLYDTSDGVMRDLVAGRIDMAILDPPLVELAIAEHPEWDLHQVELQPDPAFPIMSTKYNVVMGVARTRPRWPTPSMPGCRAVGDLPEPGVHGRVRRDQPQLLHPAGPEPARRG